MGETNNMSPAELNSVLLKVLSREWRSTTDIVNAVQASSPDELISRRRITNALSELLDAGAAERTRTGASLYWREPKSTRKPLTATVPAEPAPQPVAAADPAEMPREAQERGPWVERKLAEAGVTAETHRVALDGSVHPRLPHGEPTRLKARSCCASTEGDVHIRTCDSPAAREQWEPRGLDGWATRQALKGAAPLTPYIEALETAVAGLREQAAAPPAALGPITVAELTGRTAEHSADNLLALDRALTNRIVKRAQYDALRRVLDVLNEWIEGVRINHRIAEHRGSDCCDTFHPDDIRSMVNEAARELGTLEPHRPKAGA